MSLGDRVITYPSALPDDPWCMVLSSRFRWLILCCFDCFSEHATPVVSDVKAESAKILVGKAETAAITDTEAAEILAVAVAMSVTVETMRQCGNVEYQGGDILEEKGSGCGLIGWDQH